MAAIDKVEPIVREALKRNGWILEKKPLVIIKEDNKVEIDIQAERIIAATKGAERIVV